MVYDSSEIHENIRYLKECLSEAKTFNPSFEKKNVRWIIPLLEK